MTATDVCALSVQLGLCVCVYSMSECVLAPELFP